MSIVIFSRPVRSGKTTALMQWCDQITATKNVGGILMPDVDGSRKLLNISTKEWFDIECKDPSTTRRSLIAVGNFHFYTDAFEKGNTIILQASSKSDLLIIDEVGKLELEGKGFYQSISGIFKNDEYKNGLKSVLLVVRDELYEAVLSFFEITKHRLITTLSAVEDPDSGV
jgi:nucleoside-triphosphatase